MSTVIAKAPNHGLACRCTAEWPFDRVYYHYGQMLGVRHFRAEHDYHCAKRKLHNRTLHGYGAVCGLAVVAPRPEPPSDRGEPAEKPSSPGPQRKPMKEQEDAPSPKQREIDECEPRPCPPRVLIECGLALDCEGNELFVHDPLCVNLLDLLSDTEHEIVTSDDYRDRSLGDRSLWISLCFHEIPMEPTRPVLAEACNAAGACHFGMVRDSVCVKVTLEKPEEVEDCGLCCEPCGEPCVLLAEVKDFMPDRPIHFRQIHNEVRRPVSVYRPTTITGVSWVHGATYTEAQAEAMLKAPLVVKFSRPVLAGTLPGAIDVLLFRGGGSIRGNVAHLAGRVHLPGGDPTCALECQLEEEGLADGDRILIIVRTNFILDECCQPVDGEHVGGWVPQLGEYKKPTRLIAVRHACPMNA